MHTAITSAVWMSGPHGRALVQQVRSRDLFFFSNPPSLLSPTKHCNPLISSCSDHTVLTYSTGVGRPEGRHDGPEARLTHLANQPCPPLQSETQQASA